MLPSKSYLGIREEARAEIAAATERFLAAGNAVHQVPIGVSGESTDSKKRVRAFRINCPDKPKAKPRTPAAKAPNAPHVQTERRKESLRKAHAARIERHAEARRLLATKVAIQAALGDHLTKIAADLGVSHRHVRKIAEEFNITIGRKAQ